MPVDTIQISSPDTLAQTVRRAAEIFHAGGLVVFPTETVYGIAASAASGAGVAALRQFKERPDEQPFAVHLPDAASAHRYADLNYPAIRRLLHKVFPGPVTLIVEVSDDVIAEKVAALGLGTELAQRLYHQNTIGLRCPDDEAAQAILGSVSEPVVASSANRRGQSPPQDAIQAAQGVGDAAQLIVDGGRCRFAKASTVVRLVRAEHGGMGVKVERAGVYDERFIHKLMRWTMLLVCSGNTCRSPMAEGLARQLLAQQRNLPVEELETVGVRVLSAGAFAMAGAPAADAAQAVMRQRGVDISSHRARLLTRELIHEADVIYCMSRSHLQAVLQMAPNAAGKTFLLDPHGDIADPIGGSTAIYDRTAEQIHRQLEQRLKEQQP